MRSGDSAISAVARRRVSRVALGLGVVAVLGALGLLGAACASNRPVVTGLLEGRLRPCPDTPNCVCSEPGSGDAAIEPLRFECDPDAAFFSLIAHLESLPRVSLRAATDDYVHAVFRTPIMRFADDVELRLDRSARVIHVRSASRVGHSDLGANRRRVERLRASWDPEGD